MKDRRKFTVGVLLTALTLLTTFCAPKRSRLGSAAETTQATVQEPPDPPSTLFDPVSYSDENTSRAVKKAVSEKGRQISLRNPPSSFDRPQEPPEPETSPLDEIANLNLYEVEVDPALEHLVSEDLKNTRFDVPVVVNRQVLSFLDYYQKRGRKVMEEGLRRSGQYLPVFHEIFSEHGIPLDLIYMAHVESLFKPYAYSRAHARGIWQFVAGTARLYGLKIGWWIDERSHVEKSTDAAARYLKDLHEEFGDWYLVLAGYNGGPGRVRRAIRRYGETDYWRMARRRLLPRDTRNYVPSILASIIIYKNPERYGFNVEPDPPVQFEKVALDYQVDLRVIADTLQIELGQLEALNPELRRGITPYESADYELKVPVGAGESLLAKLAAIPPEKRLRVTHHTVRRGETLSGIAYRYGTSIRAIAEVNRIRNVNRLSLGQDLVIPLSNWRAFRGDRVPASERPDVYTVRRGDSLYTIARRFGLRLADLLKWNSLSAAQLIFPGQRLRLFGSSVNDGP